MLQVIDLGSSCYTSDQLSSYIQVGREGQGRAGQGRAGQGSTAFWGRRAPPRPPVQRQWQRRIRWQAPLFLAGWLAGWL